MPERAQLLELLLDHQRKVSDLLDEAERGLDTPGDDRAGTMASIRWRLVRVLRNYQLFKHRMIFDPIIASGNAARGVSAAALKTRCIEAGDAYQRHVLKWSLDGVGDWPGYPTDKSTVIDAIRKHLAREAKEARAVLA